MIVPRQEGKDSLAKGRRDNHCMEGREAQSSQGRGERWTAVPRNDGWTIILGERGWIDSCPPVGTEGQSLQAQGQALP